VIRVCCSELFGRALVAGLTTESDPIGIVPAHIQSHENSSDDETKKPDQPVDQGWEDVQWKEALAAEPDDTLRREQGMEFRRLRRDREDDADLQAYSAELDKDIRNGRKLLMMEYIHGHGLYDISNAWPMTETTTATTPPTTSRSGMVLRGGVYGP
jgi:hypothetical protein